MNDTMLDSLENHEPVTETLEIAQPRAVGSPLPRGNGGRVQMPQSYDDLEVLPSPLQPEHIQVPPQASAQSSRTVLVAPQPAQAPSAGPVLARRRATAAPAAPPTGFQRAVGALRTALPIVQRILPLLDGNIGTAVSNILTPRPQATPAPPTVNLAPIQESISDLQVQHRNLREQITEQNSSLKRVEDQLEMVREATDRNTLEQQELLEDLKSMGSKVNLVAAIAIGLLGISLVVNMALYFHIQRVLP